jgi:hypothetical protein
VTSDEDEGEVFVSQSRNPSNARKKAGSEVESYLEGLKGERKSSLSRLRSIILETVPRVEESLRSKMPYYEYHGMLCAFASQKNYMSFYILNGQVVENHRHLLRGLSVGKGCIRFNKLSDIGEETVQKLLRAAAKANEITFNDHC